MSVPTCDHLKEDGVFCSSPALKDQKYCYFHLNLRARRLKAARARRRGANPTLNLPFPEDMHSVQVSLAEIMWAIADNRIDTKRAGLILYMLQQAATNLNHTPGWNGKREAVPSNRPLRAFRVNFEKRFGLPPNTDLDPNFEEETFVPPQSSPVGAPPLSSSFGDRAGIDEEGCPIQAQLERESSPRSTGEPSTALETPNSSPDRVPFPEDELKKLNMTHREKLEFFLYEGRFDDIDPAKERDLMLAWLREKRRLTKAQYLAAQSEPSGGPLDPLDGPEYTDTQNPPFGFLNSLEDDDDQEAEAA